MSLFVRLMFGVLVVLSLLFLAPDTVFAYGGPGSVISGIGTLLAALAAILASLFGFVWFPLKRLYRKLSDDEVEEEEPA